MGASIPPLPLPEDEFNRRVAAGAKTLEEIDPAFATWLKRQERLHAFQAACIGIGGLVLAATLIVVAVNS